MTISRLLHTLIDSSVLNNFIRTTKPVILDATRNGLEIFSKFHIPGARYFDQSRCVQPTPTCVHGFPEHSCFEKYVQELGLKSDEPIVIYDQGLVPVSASRAKWTLDAFGFKKVLVLNGGLKTWVANNGTVTDEIAHYEKSDCKLSVLDNLIVNFDKMERIVHNDSHVILDTRNEGNFKGILPEPSSSTVHVLSQANQPLPVKMYAGHMPGAINFNLGRVINPENGTIIEDPNELKNVFDETDIDLSKPVVTVCYNGNNASLLRLVLNMVGKTDVSVYYGSWTEYGQLCKINK